jgi:hypothetical protein
MADVTACGCPAQQDEAKAGRRMQYFYGWKKPASIFLRFLFDRLNNLP